MHTKVFKEGLLAPGNAFADVRRSIREALGLACLPTENAGKLSLEVYLNRFQPKSITHEDWGLLYEPPQP